MDAEKLVEAVAEAIDCADVGYTIKLTRLLDNETTYRAVCDGMSCEFESHEEAALWVNEYRLKAKAHAALAVALPALREVARDAVLRAKPGYAIADIRARFDALAKEVQANG